MHRLEHPKHARLLTQIRERCRKLCVWSESSFPGSQPVSLSKSNLSEILRNLYVACEKTDGVRYMLYAATGSDGRGHVYLLDRSEEVMQCSVTLPTRDRSTGGQLPTADDGRPLKTHHDTLLDGELVEDVAKPSNGGGSADRRLRFLIYDAIAINGVSVVKENLLERLKKALVEVVEPRRQWMVQNEAPNEPFEIFLKDFFEIWHIPTIMGFSSKLPHESDGIIFTPVKVPYIPGTCRQLLKWKPPHLNTVDFRIEVIYNGKEPAYVKLYVAKHGVNVPYGWLAPVGDMYHELMAKARKADELNPSGQIWECFRREDVKTFLPIDLDKYTAQGEWVEGGWIVQRLRDDKLTANDVKTVNKVEQSITDCITYEELCRVFQDYRDQGKKQVAELTHTWSPH